MKLAWLMGIVAAIVLHAGILLFGGIFFLNGKKDHGTVQAVELLTSVDDEKKKPEEEKKEPVEEIKTDEDHPPDTVDLIQNVDTPSFDDAPALEAASLSAIEAALNGLGNGGDFSESLTFASGGIIGGTGKGGKGESVEESMAVEDLDQPPRVTFQNSPTQPLEMRGKKIEGVVTVKFVVNVDGRVENARVEKSSHKAFEAAALSAIKQWKFEPGVRGGQRVPSTMRISIRFPPS
jgi:TonB family protein